MNSLRVDEFFVWSSYGTGMGGTIGMGKARSCRHLGSHAFPGVWWAPRARCFSRLYNPLYPIFSVHFLSPPIHRSSHLHEYGGRQGLFGTTWSQYQLYPRHTGVYSPLLPPWVKVFSCISQKLVVIGGTVETARRASISAWNGFVDCSYLLLRRYCWLKRGR